jgi:hypothetical protein
MSVPINQAIFQMGTVEQRFFSKDCEPGDTETFNISFPTPFPAQGVRVIVTANSLNVPRGAHNAAVVGIAQQVTPAGFVLRARNSDCADAGGFAGMNWMAVLETPDIQQKPINIRMGVLQPQSFSPDCESGDTRDFGGNFSTSINDNQPVVLVTASNLNVQGHNAAVVGTVLYPQTDTTGVVLKGRNSDCASGGCGFYYVALSHKTPGRADLIVDTGDVHPQNFFADCTEGDTRSWDVYFHQPFLTPPVVLVTANGSEANFHNAAAVGMARNVTPYGFTLVGRNSDCFGEGGVFGPRPAIPAGFYWVAIGCAVGCG